MHRKKYRGKKIISKLFALISGIMSVALISTYYSIPPVQVRANDLLETSYQSRAVGSSLEDQLRDVQKKLGEVTKQKQDLQNAIATERNKQGSYSNELAIIRSEKQLIESEISEKQLIIEELNLQIEILNNSIIETEKIVKSTETEIAELEVVADEQILDMYVDYKTANIGINAVFADGNISIIKSSLYQKSIQETTQNSLIALGEQYDKLKSEKEKLEANRVDVEVDKKSLDEEKAALDSKQRELQSKFNRLNELLAQTTKTIAGFNESLESLDDESAKLVAQQEFIQQSIFNSVGVISSGQYVVKGTIIGQQGLTGLTTGYHLHFGVAENGATRNPCGYLPAGRIGNCAGNGKIDWPMKGSFVMTSGYGDRNLGGRSSFHAAIDLANSVNNAPIYAAHNGWLRVGEQIM